MNAQVALTPEQVLAADLDLERRLHTKRWSDWLAYSREIANAAMQASEPVDDANDYEPGDYDLLYQAALVLSIVAAPANSETAPALVSRTRYLRSQVHPDKTPQEPR